MPIFIRHIFLPLFILLALSSCGGGSEGTGGSPTVGVNPNALVKNLNTQEREIICDEIKARAAANYTDQALCETMALMDLDDMTPNSSTANPADLENSCKQIAQPCIESREQTECNGNYTCGLEDADFIQGCAATVRGLQACINDILRAQEAQYRLESCSNAFEYVNELLDYADALVTFSPECGEAFNQCPGLNVISLGPCGASIASFQS